ncbi:MAG: PPP4R2-domain-containing protein [Benjaminiella poitrasii]|nr:MAG: PPP4R2-domain-containing protein [Benjaminiella poitrasii]
MPIEEKTTLTSASSDTSSDTEETMSANGDDVKMKTNINKDLFVEINNTLDAITPDPVLLTIAETNQVEIGWDELQKILIEILSKQREAMESKLKDKSIKQSVDDLSMKITHIINDHKNCPFTIQRLCELVIEPKKYYKMYIKYLRAVEKVLLVTSYWEDYVHSAIDDELESLLNNNHSSTFSMFNRIGEVEVEPIEFDTSHEDSNEIEENQEHDKDEEQKEKETDKFRDNKKDIATVVKENKNSAEGESTKDESIANEELSLSVTTTTTTTTTSAAAAAAEVQSPPADNDVNKMDVD